MRIPISTSLPLSALIATALTLSLSLSPDTSSIVLIPSQNLTLPPSPRSNATKTARLGSKWPDAPFRRHLAWDTDVEVLSRTPSDPAPQSSILGDIRLLGVRARAEGPGLALIQNWHDVSGSVEFWFHAAEELFTGSDVASVLEVVAEMTNVYGAAGVDGSLVKGGVEIAYFELGLRI